MTPMQVVSRPQFKKQRALSGVPNISFSTLLSLSTCLGRGPYCFWLPPLIDYVPNSEDFLYPNKYIHLQGAQKNIWQRTGPLEMFAKRMNGRKHL